MVYANSINAVSQALLDRSGPLIASGEALRASIQERFDTETDPQGQPWDDWSESYKPVAEAYPNLGILRQSGELEDAAVSSDAVVITNDTVFYDTKLLPHYGLAHETGLEDRLPQRAFLGLSDAARSVVIGNFVEWFDQSIALFVTARGNIGRRHSIRGGGGMFTPRASVGKAPLGG